MHRLKSAILLELKNCQNGTFELVHGIQNLFLAKRLPLKHYEDAILKKIPNMSQGSQNPVLSQSKKLRFSQKRTRKISKILFNLGSCEYLARLESKIRKHLFFDG